MAALPMIATILAACGVAAAGNSLGCRYSALESATGVSSCSGESYSVVSQVCCYDDTVARDNLCQGGNDCEGGSIFDFEAGRTCCGGQYQKQTEGRVELCCGGKLTEVKDGFQCCGGTYQELEFGDNSRCCDGKIIDAETTACCTSGSSEAAYERDGSKACCDTSYLEKPANSLCCSGKFIVVPGEFDSPTCCGSDLIDQRIATCCEAKQHKNLDGHRCCGSDYGSLDDTECCGSSMYDKKLNRACCGEKYYNFQTESCAGDVCDGGVICDGTDRTAAQCGQCDFDGETQQCFEVYFVPKSQAAQATTAGALAMALTALLLL